MTDVKLEKFTFARKDLDFVVREAAPEFEDKNKLKQLIREDPAFRKGLIGDEKVFRQFDAEF